ncbi:MAG: hypothetical protein WCT46_06435 [Candidatus Gracilibacteria bacterium]
MMIICPKNLLDNVVNFSITIQEGEVEEVEEVWGGVYGGGVSHLGVQADEISIPEDVLSVEEEEVAEDTIELISDLKNGSVVGGNDYNGLDESYIYSFLGGVDLFPKENISSSQSDDGLITSNQDPQIASSYDKLYMDWVNLETVVDSPVLFTYAYDRESLDPIFLLKKRLLYSVTGAGCGIFSFSIFLSFIEGVSFRQIFIGLIRFLK